MKKFLYLMLGICSILAVVAAIVLLTSKINTLIFICASVIIFLFSILAYIFIGVFFASLWGKKIKGTIIKEIKDEKIVDGVIVEKYITQFAYINRDNKLIRDEVNKIYDCGFVPIRLLGNFKYIDSQLNSQLYENAIEQKIDKKAAARNEFVPPDDINRKKRSKRFFLIYMFIWLILILISIIF